MKFVAYRSRIISSESAESLLADIVATASQQNPKHGITGILFFTGEYFLQVVEGLDREVDQLYANIAKDRRHTDLQLLYEGKITHRMLPEWNMELADLTVLSSFTDEQVKKAIALLDHSMGMDAETFLFMVRELSDQPEFQALLN